MAEAAAAAEEEPAWKRHILRQLRRRDRAEKARFLALVQAYHRLLEKSSVVDHFTAKLEAQSVDHPLGSPLFSSAQDTFSYTRKDVSDSGETAESMQRIHKGHVMQLQSVNGELAYKLYERNMLLRAKEATLEEQKGRLAWLSGRLSALESERRHLRAQVEGLSRAKAALKEEYKALLQRRRCQDGELRRAAEKGLKLLKGLLQGKADAAQQENERIERAKQARLSKELKKAAKTPVSVQVEPEKQDTGSRNLPEDENGEKLRSRPFRSASASSMTLTRYMDVFKGLFDFRLKRGNSISNVSVDRYSCLPLCAATCPPSQVSDVQEAHASEVNAIRFSPNTSLLATGGTDRLIRLWNVVGGRLESLETLEGANGSLTSIDFDPSGCHVLAATHNNAVQLWKIGECRFKEILTGHTDKVTAARFRSTRHQVVTGSRDRTVKEWDLGKGTCTRTIHVFSYCNDVVCGDTIIISGHHDQTIRFWDSREPRCTQVIPVEGTVTSLSLSLDQMHLLSCSRDNALKVVDLRMHNVRQVFRADGFKCGSDYTKAVFSPDNSYALVGSADGTLFLWSMETSKLEATLPGVHRSAVNAVAWSPSGTCVGSVERCRKVVLWR
uniref:Protein Atg16l2 isoform X1 n=1 Tax=Pogona vitticeps TaxID=103695 RepID=A0ABM5FVS9_9SAUR